MANAADFLQLSQTQLVVPYKLRSRSISGINVTATNIATNYSLTADISTNLEGASVSPSRIELAPNQSTVLTVTFQTAPLETYPVGVLTNSLNFVVNAVPVVIPVPPPPPPPPPPPAPPVVFGCTDASAMNYNPQATSNDGTCIPKIFGCTNINALNYNPRANMEDGSCQFVAPPLPGVLGCTNVNAINYNQNATQDDGSCIARVIGCRDINAENYNADANTSCEGCCQYRGTDPLPPAIQGCTDRNAKNYDPSAVLDNGTCIQYIFGCTNPFAFNYDRRAEKDNNTCKFTGCTDPLANNYVQGDNIEPCVNNSCCTYDKKIEPCLEIGKITQTGLPVNQDPSYTNVCRLIQDTFVGGCRESCSDEYTGTPARVGCTDQQATNYNPDATQNDGSCIYVTGCMDKSAINYNPYAVRDNGTCRYETRCLEEGEACDSGSCCPGLVCDDGDGVGGNLGVCIRPRTGPRTDGPRTTVDDSNNRNVGRGGGGGPITIDNDGNRNFGDDRNTSNQF